MDMRQLRYFVQIVESGSMSKAARQLLIAQPALSHHMARLEDEVGKVLLVRSARGVVATQHGDLLYHHAKFILRQIAEAVAVVRQDCATVSGRVTIGLPPTTVNIIGLQLLRHIKRKFPGITLNVVEALSSPLEDMARQGQLDLAVLIRHSGVSDLGFEPLLTEELCVILPAHSKLVPPDKKSLTLAEVSELPLILPSSNPTNSLRRRIMLEFERANLAVNLVSEIDSLVLLLRLIAEGDGVTIRTISMTKTLNNSYEWRAVPISDAYMIITHYIYSLPRDKLSSCASIVRNEVKDVVRQFVHCGEWPGTLLVNEQSSTPE